MKIFLRESQYHSLPNEWMGASMNLQLLDGKQHNDYPLVFTFVYLWVQRSRTFKRVCRIALAGILIDRLNTVSVLNYLCDKIIAKSICEILNR